MIRFSHMDDNLPVSQDKKSTLSDNQVKTNDKPVESAQASEKEQLSGSFFKEAEPRLTEKKEIKVPAEVKDWVTEVETAEEVTLPEPVKDDYGQVLVSAAAPIKPELVLPLTKQKVNTGLHKKVYYSIRWLAEWCLRLVKMFPERVKYGSSK